MTATEILKTRVTPEMKARVAKTTQAELLTEAVWLRRLVAKELRETQGAPRPLDQAAEQRACASLAGRGPCSKHLGPAARLYVRMRREDRLLLHERAAARGMASATYVSVLVRSHLRALTPLPRDELAALKQAVGELGAIGRNLNQITRAINQGRVAGTYRAEFEAVLKICGALRDNTKNFIKANTASWATGYVDDAP